MSLLNSIEKGNQWGPLTSNLLLIGQRGCITPIHYDEQQNLFAQLRGYKLFILASPAYFSNIPTFPVGHPVDRQGILDIRLPDVARYTGFTHVKFVYALLRPGDIMYLPAYWFHYVESPLDETISLNFWFRSVSPQNPVLPLTDPMTRVSLRRNIEKMIGGSMTFKKSSQLFRKIGRGEALTADELRGKATVLMLLGQVLAATEVEAFLVDMCRLRFELPQRDEGGGGSGGSGGGGGGASTTG